MEQLSDLAAQNYDKETMVDTNKKVNYRFGNAATQQCVSRARVPVAIAGNTER